MSSDIIDETDEFGAPSSTPGEEWNLQEPIAFLRGENEYGETLEVPILLDQDMVFGRDEECNVIISDLPVVSKRHFRIYSVVFEKNHIRKIQPLIYCEDLESTNGTYVNDVCIGMLGRERAGHLLSHGDVIEVRPSCRFRLVQAFQNECKDHGRLEDIEYFRDRYAISDRLLGKGNYGAVFLASDASTSKQLACKIINVKRALYELGKTQPSLNPRRGAISSAGMDVVMREIRILADLDHPNIVTLRKAFHSHDKMYTFIDLASGGDLFSYLDHKDFNRLSDSEARLISRQIVLAVQFMHGKGIAHRDIKPENVLIMQTDLGGRVVLTDFGFATKVNRVARMHSKVGTNGYNAPEVDVEDLRLGYTTAVDLWSLGVLTVFMLTGYVVVPREGLSQYSQQEFSDRFLTLDDNAREPWLHLRPRALKFLRGLLIMDPDRRMTATQALSHSWFTKPRTEAEALKDCYSKIIQFWQKRGDGDGIIEFIPRSTTMMEHQPNEISGCAKFRRKLPDASSSPYFSLERHLIPKVQSQRKALLDNLYKSGSQFVPSQYLYAAPVPKHQLHISSRQGRDMFGNGQAGEADDHVDVEDEVVLVSISPPVQRLEKAYGINLSDPARAVTPPVKPVESDSLSSVGSPARKRVRWESEDPEERRLRDDVAKQMPRYESAKALSDALKKQKMERLQKLQTAQLKTLAHRNSSIPFS